ncbi:MAG: hypoxanthine phosphoribosyltransferase [Akkermansiaceae bacterium]|jgi:hypoxanthine phosphoribosyltransferase|nr:hypoxanthine phosphoribosyltransferase [Akkermansiaceae bacterium]
MSTNDNINDLERVLFSELEINSRLDELAKCISTQYDKCKLTVVSIMNGSLMLAADLFARLEIDFDIKCLVVESYYGETKSSGEVFINCIRMPNFSGRHVLIVDDVFDTGKTLEAVIQRINRECNPIEVSSLTLLKKKKETKANLTPDFVGFEVDDLFLVGYGLDYHGKYRNLRVIGELKEEVMANPTL